MRAQPSMKFLRSFAIFSLSFLPIARRRRSALRERVAGKFARSSHDLFLVNHDAVGVGADVLQQRMQIFDRRDALFRFHIFRDELHRAGPVQRDQCDDVVELFDVELLRKTGHAAGFHLEKADRFAAVVERKGSGIIQRNILSEKFGSRW